jgi:DNA-binding response OmpR family regulator
MTYRNEGAIAGKFTRFQALELEGMKRSLLRAICASGPHQKINCITYGKLLTIKRLVSRFVLIRRFAGGRRRQSKSGRGCGYSFWTMPARIARSLKTPSGSAPSKSAAPTPSSRSSRSTSSPDGRSRRPRATSSVRQVDLTSSEFDLLAFVRQPGQALSRNALLGTLRGREWTYFDRSIDTLVARLRKKLAGGADRAPLVRSVRGVGYIFCAAVARICQGGQSAAA